MAKAIAKRIEVHNAGRDAELTAVKFAAMKQDAFLFLRGSCRLFYEDLSVSSLPASPKVWCCGDLHWLNFGAYKGVNRLTYFDLTDFDETCLAPASWDLVRYLTSALVGGKILGLDRAKIKPLLSAFLDGYRSALVGGKARWLERELTEGMIGQLLTKLESRTRKKFLSSRVETVKGKRRLIVDPKKIEPLKKSRFEQLSEFMKGYAKQQEDPRFFRLLDAAQRIAGTGSLGLERYLLLVEGRGSPNENFLLDMKFQPGSAVVAARKIPQPKWKSEAERVAVTQNLAQTATQALLQAVQFDGRSFLLRELMPANDKIDLAKGQGKDLEQTIHAMGELVGWANLRTANRRGSASAEELVAFGRDAKWGNTLVVCAHECADQTEKQWREFAEKS